MKNIIPYTKELEFKSKIAEICSVSLEHELEIGDTEITGNFIVSGEYKSHEISVNKESFSFKLPFSVEVTENILKDTIDFEITDFTYEMVSDTKLRVDIEFMVTADEKKMEEETIKEEQENNEVRDAVIEEIDDLFKDEEEPIEEERMDEESQELILNSVPQTEDEFASYHIHIVSESETVESICAMYQTDIETLNEYNMFDTLTEGDKLIIPFLDE